ncbi:MAG: hypothetical protein MUF54_03470, partial [Polyangiaceae bacterium]|nr:hypothetical protein [Polyangiaceae bacterium]
MGNQAVISCSWLVAVAAMVAVTGTTAAQDASATSSSTEAAPTPTDSSAEAAIPLPTIPPPQSIVLPAPPPEVVSELDTLLQKLTAVEPRVREGAMGALASQDSTVLPAIAIKLAALRKGADRAGIEAILAEARKAARRDKKRDDEEDELKSTVDAGRPTLAAEEQTLLDTERTDWLQYVLREPLPDRQAYTDLVAVLGLARTCACIGTTEAARQIINVYTYFGDLFRIDVQRQLARMKDRALPALIEAQYHYSRMVRTWAKRRLDVLGRAIPSEAVRINDNQALADVLRAYGRAREVEATRVIVSFANSDRLQVREAAREALGQIGDPARWQLRDAYEDLMGDKPPRTWDWRRTARE